MGCSHGVWRTSSSGGRRRRHRHERHQKCLPAPTLPLRRESLPILDRLGEAQKPQSGCPYEPSPPHPPVPGVLCAFRRPPAASMPMPMGTPFRPGTCFPIVIRMIRPAAWNRCSKLHLDREKNWIHGGVDDALFVVPCFHVDGQGAWSCVRGAVCGV